MIKVVIFDFDGVLINEYSKHYELNKKWISDLTEEEFLDLFDGNVHESDIKLDDRKTNFNFMGQFDKYKSSVVIKKEIKEFIIELSKKYTLGIISSGIERGTKDSLVLSGLEGVFSFVYGYETDVLKTKKFKIAMKNFDFTKDECVFVTDTVGDVLEANEVGIKSIAVDFGYQGRERFENSNPLKIVSSIDELKESILGLE